MPDDDHQQQGQLDRARRLREQIERLEKGEPVPSKEPSLREQIAERERELDKGKKK